MELRDDQPQQHEFGRRTYIVADVEPLDVDGTRTVLIGTLAWVVAFLALLPFRTQLVADSHEWMLWTCLAGAGLGCLGLEYCRRRRVARSQQADDADHVPPSEEESPA